jgi:uncharacterized membrane protein
MTSPIASASASVSAEAERFLKEVRRGLGPLQTDERDDVIEELRSHLIERAAQGQVDVLAGFEDPSTLAASFVEERALRGALSAGTPWAHARAILGSTGDSLLLLCALVPLVLGQLVAALVVLTATLKLFAPSEFGVWVGPGAFYVGRATPLAHEVLGLWGFPVLLAVGVLLFWMSSRGLRALARSRLTATRAHRAA